MMPQRSPLHLSVLTPGKVLFDAPVDYLFVPGGAGDFGVLRDHAAMIASLKPGSFEVRPSSGTPLLFKTAHPALFEVVKNKASILLDAGDTASFPKI
ncbi:MAG: F0F1 ATP synthase subunit epsilon [Candidatus Omnitrophota bacterium]